MAEKADLDSITGALLTYTDALRDLTVIDDEASALFGFDWRSKPHEVTASWRSREAALELLADRAISAAVKMPARVVVDIAAKLRLAFCIASGCDWSSPMILQLILSAAIDASRLAEGLDRQIERRYFGDSGSHDSLALASARAVLADWNGSALVQDHDPRGEEPRA